MPTSNLKILAIDDNQDNLTTLQAVVSDRLPGAKVLTALNGKAGLELARAEDPDVILLDIVMPVMDGYEVCRKLKADAQLQGIPVLFLTALRTDLASRVAAMDAGAEGFLSKPFDEIELFAQIRAMAKIKAANRHQRLEKEELEVLVADRTRELALELTAHHEAEEALRESEKKYSKAFQTSPYAITITRAEDGGFVDVNDAFTAMTGVTREEALANTSVGLKLWVNEEERLRVVADLRAGRVVGGREYHFRIKSGEIITGIFSASIIKAKSAVCILSSINDITESRRAAEEKTYLEGQLRQAQKVEAVGRLAGGVAHDFNNVTAIILGYAELLLGQLGPQDPSRNWVEQIVAAGNRSAALTRQLLAFSRRQVLLPVVLDLNALLRDLEKLLGPAIGEDIDLKLVLGANPGRITADPGQIGQVVTNLVLNARDAMPRGGSLTVETADVDLDETYLLDHESVVPGSYVLLALTDSGCGMDKATLGHLFEPFFTTKEQGKGTGLGLASSFGIVKQSGGYLWVYSELGRGTTFKIYLPRTNAALSATSAQSGDKAVRGNGETILLVEDETGLRELCEIVLARLGYRVSAAVDGLDALRQVRERRLEPDLVLTDVIMPGMSGPELAEVLRHERPGLKVLHMSGYPDEAIARHGIVNPGIPFLPKPFTERALATKVHEVLGVPALGKNAAGVSSGAAANPAKQEKTAVAQTAPVEKTEVGPAGKTVAPTTRRVLMIDDDEQYRELVGHFCTKRGHVFAGVGSAAAAIRALAGSSFDVLLVDLNIPGTSGEQILREIRAAGHTAPAIILTGDVASADMDVLHPLGALSAVEKSSDAEPLLRAIEAAALEVRP